jgi:hypothetical protein
LSKRRQLAFTGLLVLVLVAVGIARAEVVQQFGFTIKDVHADGRYTVVFNSRSYDSDGTTPAVLLSDTIRLPKGAVLRRQFVNSRYYCDLKKLVDKLRTDHPNAAHFNDLVNQAIRGRRTAPTRGSGLIAVCRFAHIGGGTALLDARPYVEQPIPAHFEMFWAKPNKGAVGTMAVVGSADDASPVVAQNPTIRNTHPILSVDFVDDPTVDGVYRYKLVLPTGPIAGINMSFAEVHATTPGLTLARKTVNCLKRKGQRCARRKVTKTNLFWFTKPTCPPSGRLSFQASYVYAGASPQTKTIEIPCPDFK